MRNSILFILLTAILIMGSCKRHPTPIPTLVPSTFPHIPVNMGSSINSIYDDYNSTIPVVPNGTMGISLFFSSNRNSNGNNFDIISKLLSIHAYGTGSVTVEGTPPVSDPFTAINTNSNQLGPYFIGATNTLLYATDDGGNLDIKYLSLGVSNPPPPSQAIKYLNSPYDDAYPSISKTNSYIYFCSNRSGDFDIYKGNLNTANTRRGHFKNLLQNLADTTSKTIIKMSSVDSVGYDDKCPYVVGNTMVFTSNRPGGYGGFDLYYSVYTNGAWSTPTNFGGSVNTTADEYRPIVLQINGFINNLMIFSSNRTGGMGGFDLYYVGITAIDMNAPTE